MIIQRRNEAQTARGIRTRLTLPAILLFRVTNARVAVIRARLHVLTGRDGILRARGRPTGRTIRAISLNNCAIFVRLNALGFRQVVLVHAGAINTPRNAGFVQVIRTGGIEHGTVDIIDPSTVFEIIDGDAVRAAAAGPAVRLGRAGEPISGRFGPLRQRDT